MKKISCCQSYIQNWFSGWRWISVFIFFLTQWLKEFCSFEPFCDLILHLAIPWVRKEQSTLLEKKKKIAHLSLHWLCQQWWPVGWGKWNRASDESVGRLGLFYISAHSASQWIVRKKNQQGRGHNNKTLWQYNVFFNVAPVLLQFKNYIIWNEPVQRAGLEWVYCLRPPSPHPFFSTQSLSYR